MWGTHGVPFGSRYSFAGIGGYKLCEQQGEGGLLVRKPCGKTRAFLYLLYWWLDKPISLCPI